MKRAGSALPFLVLVPWLLAADDPSPKPVRFREHVAPILVRSCLGCHNDQKAESGLNMKTMALLRKGGKTLGEGILEPGDPDSSHLIELIRPGASPRMPYKQKPLSDAEIQTLERWVADGAKLDGPSEWETPIASLVDPLKHLPRVEVKVATSDPITSVVYSPDGSWLAASHGKNVQLFETNTGRLTATLAGHPGPLTALRITPDGKTLVAAGGRAGMFGAVTVWDIPSRSKRAEFRGHADGILTADLSPDGKTLATGSYDRLIMLWDIVEGKPIRTLKEHTDAVYGVAYSPDGTSLASVSGDRTVKVWDVATGRKRVTMSDATAELYAVAFTADSKTVLASGVDRSIRAWILEGDSATLSRSVFAHDAAVLRLVVSPDGKTLLSSGEDTMVKLWDLPSLAPRSTLGRQPDWPLALAMSPDGSRIALGRYDGSLALFDAATSQPAVALQDAPKPEPKTPELVRNATLNPPNPRGALRGTTVRVTLSGNGVGEAHEIVFPEPGITVKRLPREKPNPNALDVELTIAPDARPGLHAFGVRTPLGTPGFQNFAVSSEPETAEVEPNNEPGQVKPVALPATLLGTINAPGDLDYFRFVAKKGQTLVFETLARPMGSSLNGLLSLLDESGRSLAESSQSVGALDPTLTFAVPRDMVLTLRVADADFGGSGNHFYRIRAGELSRVESIFPLGFRAGVREDRTVSVEGANLDGVSFPKPWERDDLTPGSIVSASTDGRLKVVAADGLQTIESEGNDDPSSANPIASPGGVSGRIHRPGDRDLFKFEARKGERLIVEVFGQRLGTPIDPVIEILDTSGSPVPRAVLRPVEETEVAFRDHASTGRNIRLTQWNGFAMGDYVLVGRELMRLSELPRNPDDDAVFWGLGLSRISPGERIGFLETTPEHHPQGQPIYKVEIHPPGTSFPPGGVAPVTLNYRNDDGGPGFGEDARLTFDPPADGSYLVRVEDVRGMGGDQFGYHLVVRRPKPDFRVSLSTDHPNIPRGGGTVVVVNLSRIDGFDGPVDVTLENLPAGVTATSTTVERDQYAADLVLLADPDAPPFPEGNWTVSARAAVAGSEGNEIRHAYDPGGPSGGWITVTPEPNLKIGFRPERIEIHPGERVEMTLTVDRRNGFSGRVPIDVHNLPFGVRVLNIGLNGVLVTEQQTERSIFLYAEPWVEPTERTFFAVGRCEAAGTSDSSLPILLSVKTRSKSGVTEVSRSDARP